MWFRLIWRVSDNFRRVISILPFGAKQLLVSIIALFVYLPLARFSLLMERLGGDVSNIPLSDYRNKSFYTMNTDSLDRFGARLEKRFSRREIVSMLESVGFERIQFSNTTPLPAKIYANEGVAQVIFFESADECDISYKDRKGKYQGQTGVTLPRT